MTSFAFFAAVTMTACHLLAEDKPQPMDDQLKGANRIEIDFGDFKARGILIAIPPDVDYADIGGKIAKEYKRVALEGKVSIPAGSRLVVFLHRRGAEDGEAFKLSALEVFPTESLHFLAVELHEASAKDLSQLLRFKNLSYLTLGPLAHPTKEDLLPLTKMTWIKNLKVTGLSKELEEWLLNERGGKNLALALGNTDTNNGDLKKIAAAQDMSAIQFVNLHKTRITDEGLTYLAGMKELRSLRLSGTTISGSGLAHLSASKHLTELELHVSDVTDEGLAGIKDLTSLVIVHLDRTSISDDALVHFLRLEQLEYLRLDQTKVEGHGLRHLAGLRNLKHLQLNRTGTSDEDLRHLSGLENLEKIQLSRTNVTDEGLKHLFGLKKLTFVEVVDAKVTKAGAKMLQEALPNVAISALSLGDGKGDGKPREETDRPEK